MAVQVVGDAAEVEALVGQRREAVAVGGVQVALDVADGEGVLLAHGGGLRGECVDLLGVEPAALLVQPGLGRQVGVDDEVDVAVDALTSLIDPIMIVFLGVVVGGLVISMYLPIFSIADTVA